MTGVQTCALPIYLISATLDNGKELYLPLRIIETKTLRDNFSIKPGMIIKGMKANGSSVKRETIIKQNLSK